jgi:tRNA A58 N-methylase Trm61
MRRLHAALVLLAGLHGAARADAGLLSPARQRALDPPALVARLGLRANDIVADIGAGPGFFTLPLARAVPRGRVIATDIRTDFLDATARRAAAAGLRNVDTRLVARDRPGLAPRSIDLAFLCQVDAFLPDRVAYFRALRAALRPHGRIAVVNFLRDHDAVRRALRAAGLRSVDDAPLGNLYFVMVSRCASCRS